MPKLSIIALAAAIAAAFPAWAAGNVEVSFKASHGWADAGRGGVEVEHTQARIGQILKAQAPRLPEGQSLTIVVTDIDLAGTMRTVRSGQEVRVVNGKADWPRISLHYVLRSGNRVLREADETVAEMNYFSTLEPRAAREPLPYETQMLERWFAQRFANPQ